MGTGVLTDGSVLAMRSPINWAVLGLLIARPGYGYDLVQRFERTYGDALELSSPSQIYGALKVLKQKSLIEQLPRDEQSAGELRQPRPRYTATTQGMCRYQQWLIAQAGERRQNLGVFARALAAIDPRTALAVLDRYEQTCLSRPKSAAHDPSLAGATDMARRLVQEEERLAVEANLSLIEYARRELQAAIDARAGGGQRSGQARASTAPPGARAPSR